MKTWAFADPPNVAVFTSERILRGEDWIHYASHDADDGAWQFHPSGGITPEHEAAVVALHTIVDLDPSVNALADLPLGWHAWRPDRDAAWQRERARNR